MDSILVTMPSHWHEKPTSLNKEQDREEATGTWTARQIDGYPSITSMDGTSRTLITLRHEAVNDLIWTLANTSQFMFIQ